MKNRYKKIALFLILIIGSSLFSNKSFAEGISIDAGLTPAYKRIMVRSQFRYMHRDNHPVMTQMEMKMRMFPVMVAYGLRSDLTVMVRQAFIRKEMMSTTNSGMGDLLLLTKFRLYRKNTSRYVFGIAPILAMEFPTGKDGFTSGSYDLYLGTLFSGRLKSWASDLNIKYIINGLSLKSDTDITPGNEFSIESAISYRIGLGNSSDLLLTPVLESSYFNVGADQLNDVDVANNGESMFLMSPGFKITYNSFIFESLVQFPVWQKQTGMQTERTTGFIVGFRIMN